MKVKDGFYIWGLLVAAIILYTAGLGNSPLRDWDEGIVAAVARNMWRAEPHSNTWLFPTINYGEPYWNKPPLIHWLIALSYSLFGVSDWSTRVFPALLSASVVPLVYLIAREIFPRRLTACLSALVCLNLLPLVRHGRLAMLDGAIACWFCLGVWCLLRGRRDSRWFLGGGIALGLICLTKGIMLGVLLGLILLSFLAWDNLQWIKSKFLWSGLALGIAPALGWYVLQYQHYGPAFLGMNLGTQTFNRIWEPISPHRHPPWYYLVEIAKYGLPWLIFLPRGIKRAWQNRNSSWGKLTLTWVSVYLGSISVMVTKLPWYVLPIYPALALLVGAALSEASLKREFSDFWLIAFSLVTFLIWGATVYFGLLASPVQLDLAMIIAVLAVTFTLATGLIWLRSRYFILASLAGFYLTLIMLFTSSHWLWELNESFPVKPVAEALRSMTPPLSKVYTTYPNFRPALEFYSDRVILPRAEAEIVELWQEPVPIFCLIISPGSSPFNLADQQVLASGVSWQLITRQGN